MDTPITPERILQVGLGFMGSKTLLSAVELGLFTRLGRSPATVSALEADLGLHPRSARDFLDTLVALGLLKRSPEGIYANTPETAQFLDRQSPAYLGGLLEMANQRLYGFWGELTTALKTGLPQNEGRDGTPLFEELYADPARLKGFLSAMTGISHGANCLIAERLPWSEYRTFADIGTAQGDLAVQIALAHPHLQGIGYDLAPVEPIFTEYANRLGVGERVRFQTGDFFTEPLPAVDVLLFGHILHDWDLPTKQMLLQKAYDALPPGGMVVVYETLIDDARTSNAFGLLMSLNMLIETTGGFDFTGADCQAWMREAGFRDTRVEPLTGPDGMVIGIR